MGRLAAWTLGIATALALSAAPASADTRWNIGIHIGNGRPVYAPVYREVYYPPPVYRAPVYRERVYYPVRERAYYRPAYRDRVIVVDGRRDNGRHRGWDKKGRGPGWRDDRDYRDNRRR